MLSVIIITKNAAAHISTCLASVAWADEIIVVDAGSNDATLSLCRAFDAKVFTSADWPGFGPQKNRALSHATGEWILSIDADEQVTPALRDAIQTVLRDPHYSAYRLPRRSQYCGYWMRHGGWWPDYVIRLFRHGAAHFSDDLVHERLCVTQGAIGTLSTPLLHYPFTNFEEVLDKINRYSSAGAQMRHRQGQQGGLRRALAHGFWAFLRTYVLRAGFLDGRAGFMLAVSNAEGVYYRYLKLMDLERRAHAATVID